MVRSRGWERGRRSGVVLSCAALAAAGVGLVADAAGPAASFAPAATVPTGGSGSVSVAVADVSGDGKPDLLTANYASRTVSVIQGDGAGHFGSATPFSTGGNSPRSLAIADVNGDGKLDVATANATSNNVAVLLGNGAGGFAAATLFASGGLFPNSVALADLNADGKLDLVVGHAHVSSQELGVLLGDGSGGFGPATTVLSGLGATSAVAVADVNGDGALDLIGSSSFGSSLGVLLGDGRGSFSTAATFSSGGFWPGAVAVADVNDDGKSDLIAANNYSGTLGVLLGNGTGDFGPATTFGSGGTEPGSVVAADVNGDGKLDLIAANDSSGSTGSVGVLLGEGTGAFGPVTPFSSGGLSTAAGTVADVNTDGKPDLIAVNRFSQTVGVLLNDTNYAPVGHAESYSTRRATLLTSAAPGVLANDTDLEGSRLTAELVFGPTGGSFTLNPNGSFRYTPRLGFTGVDRFTYRASDGALTSNPVEVTINVSPAPPDSMPNSNAEAAGSIAVAGSAGSFTLSVQKAGGAVRGALAYADGNRNRTLNSTQLTALVVTGRQARIFGKGRLLSGVLVDFVADVHDVSEPGRLKDTFQIELSNGQTVGGVLTAGDVNVNR